MYSPDAPDREMAILTAPDGRLYAELSHPGRNFGPFPAWSAEWSEVLDGLPLASRSVLGHCLVITPRGETFEAKVSAAGGEILYRAEFLAADLRRRLEALKD